MRILRKVYKSWIGSCAVKLDWFFAAKYFLSATIYLFMCRLHVLFVLSLQIMRTFLDIRDLKLARILSESQGAAFQSTLVLAAKLRDSLANLFLWYRAFFDVTEFRHEAALMTVAKETDLTL